MITGLRPETFQNLQLNAGVFLIDFDASKFADADALEDGILAALEAGTNILGATKGGGTFNATPTIRQIEPDGMRDPVIGSTVIDGWKCHMTGTLMEVTPDNFARCLMACDVDKSKTNITTLTARSEIKASDYIPKVSWAGDTSEGFVLIELENVLNIGGATFTFTDKGEGTLPFDFQAHVGNLKSVGTAPFKVHFFDKAA